MSGPRHVRERTAAHGESVGSRRLVALLVAAALVLAGTALALGGDPDLREGWFR